MNPEREPTPARSAGAVPETSSSLQGYRGSGRIAAEILGDPAAVDRLWREVVSLYEAGTADAEIRRMIERKLDTLTPTVAAEIRRELIDARPAAVAVARFRDLVDDRPALGAFPRRDDLAAPTAGEWLREDPRRLAGVVAEMARFGRPDWRTIASSVAKLADDAGIAETTADRIIAAAIRNLRTDRRSDAG